MSHFYVMSHFFRARLFAFVRFVKGVLSSGPMRWEPRDFQKDLEADPARFICAVVHRRAGKTVLAVNWLLDPAEDDSWPYEPGYRGYYVAPYQGQAKDIALEYFQLMAEGEPKILRGAGSLRWDHGAEVKLIGTEYNVHKHRGKLADRVLFDETAHIVPSAWTDVFRPMLSDRAEEFRAWCIERGMSSSQGMFIGTPNGKLNQFYRFYQLGLNPDHPEWSSHFVPASTSGIMDERELQLLRAEIGDRAYAREMECSFDAGAAGSFFEDEMAAASESRRVIPFEYVGGEVFTSWHFGPSSITVAWITTDQRGRHVFFKSERFENAKVEDVAKLVTDNKRYEYSRHYAGGPKLRANDSRISIARDAGVRFLLVENQQMSDAAALVKSKLGGCVFAESMANDLIEGMRTVHAKFDEELGTFTEKAVEDLAFELAMPVVHFFGGHNDKRSDWSRPIQYNQRGQNRAA